MNTRRLRHLSLFATAAMVGILALTGCSGSGSDDSDGDAGSASDASAADSDAEGSLDSLVGAEDAPNERESAGGRAGQVDRAGITDVALGQHLVKTGAVELDTDDVEKVVDDVYVLARTSGGAVTAENTSTGDQGTADRSRMEIQVPVARFDATIEEIKSFGTYADSTTETVDVTGQVADVESRVRSAEQSISQLRVLFDRATKLGQVITLERELSRRQADLEALQAKQRALEAQTTMSTILVTMRLTDPDQPAPDDEQAGFVSGVEQGWDAFVGFVVGASHAVGLLLPFAALAAGLGWLAWWMARRFRPRPAATAPPAQPTGTSTD